MKEESMKLIYAIVKNWINSKNYTYQKKDVFTFKNPNYDGEFLLRFKNELHGFFQNGVEIPISITSKLFPTTTLNENTLLENVNADKNRLEKFLNEFDEKFDSLVTEKLGEYDGNLSTSDPLFFD